MQLIYSPTSPYVRKVMVTLIETGQKDEVALVPASGSPTEPNATVIAQNPLGKVPALMRDDGPTLVDSRVICRFLDARGRGGLYPDGRIWEVMTLEALADGILDAAILMVYEGRCRDEGQRSEAWVEAQWQKIARALDVLETRWISHLSGRLDMGQIAVGCALGYLDFRHAARDWRKGRGALVAWERTFSARPAMTETRPPA
ncbi:MAG: glutathione S-transferase [Pseudomonadota bacterium]